MMRYGIQTGIRIGLAALMAVPLSGQSADAPSAARRMAVSASVSAAARSAGEVVREIDDPYTGSRWLLVRNLRDPAGPGLLVLAAPSGNPFRSSERHEDARALTAPAAAPPAFRPVIRAGDRLVVEQNTARIEARLEAVALGPAGAGQSFAARLEAGGKVVRAVAIAPGRANLAPAAEGWR